MTTLAQSNSPSPAQALARRRLLARIGRHWRAGQRLPTVKSLASDLGVGLVNTHRAVRELVADGYLVAKPRIGIHVAEKLPPQTRTAASGAARQAFKVEIIAAEHHMLDSMHVRMMQGARQRLEEHHCEVRQRECLAIKAEQSFVELDADALIFINASKTRLVTAERHLVVAIETGWLDQFPPDRRVDHVTVNQAQGGALVGQAFRAAGIRSACFLGCMDRAAPSAPGAAYDAISAGRLAGFESSWGRAVSSRLQLKTNYYDESAGVEAAAQFLALPQRPQAVFAATDELAVGLVHGLMAHGLQPGRDYQIIGFDGQERGQAMRWGPLTSVAVPAAEMGAKAADLLLQRFGQPPQPSQCVALGCSLRPGATFVL